jgi:hydroxymethylbilane synthase
LKPLRIGTRASALARWQAEYVRAQLAESGCAAVLVLIRTSGDQDRQTPLRLIGGKGVFTKEIETALLENRVDIAVHSMKDLPTSLPPSLMLGAICKREDVRDALISRTGAKFDDLPPRARVGTSSLRRQAQLRNRRPDLEFADVRGNVETRLAKVDGGEYDAVVLAKAGLERLKLTNSIAEVLSPEVCLPAAGQGAVGVEIRVAANDLDREIQIAVAQMNDGATRTAVDAERVVLAGLSGGCDVPLGVWAREAHEEFSMDACVLSPDGREAVRARHSGAPQDSEKIARELTAMLLQRGADRLMALVSRQAQSEDLGGRKGAA